MTDELDDLDAMIEAQAVKPERKTSQAIENLIVNVDVAARLASGEKPRVLARELGVSEAAIRNRMRRADFAQLLAIESRRILMHMSKRPLSKVPYKDLAIAAATFVEKEARLRDGYVDQENRVINATFIESLNVLIPRPGDETKSLRDPGGFTEITGEEIPEIPERSDGGTEEKAESVDAGSTEE
jgi:hypothetical protein